MGGQRMRILGVDPGTVVVGFGCIEVEHGARRAEPSAPLALRGRNVVRGLAGAGAMRCVDAGVLRLGARTLPLADRLLYLARELADLLARLEPDEVALEEAFCGKSVQAALRIGEARGVILLEARRRAVPVFQFAPARIKRSVAGHGAAHKDAVAALAARLLGIDPPRPRDATDALAAAICRVEARRLESLAGDTRLVSGAVTGR
jgi:crossover junction endodeoxyribonuclease RuvC